MPKFQLKGGGAVWSEIPERGSLENLDTNLLFEASVQRPACASQKVSHILRMWRLMNFVIKTSKINSCVIYSEGDEMSH